MAAPAQRAARRRKAAIPQLSWHAARPAPIVLVSGPEAVLAERAIAALRDLLEPKTRASRSATWAPPTTRPASC